MNWVNQQGPEVDGLDVATLWEVGRVATAGLMPDLTIVLDVPADVAAARMARPLDRMEQQGAAFHARVREGFLTEAARRNGMRNLREDGWKKIRDGVSTVQEVMRVTQEF